MTSSTFCNPKVHDVLFHDEVNVCPRCGAKLFPKGDCGMFGDRYF